MILPLALLCAAWSGRVADLRSLPPEKELVRLERDTSEGAEFLRAEALLRAGRPAEALQAAVAFQVARPGSVLRPRARLLEGYSLLQRGEHWKGCLVLAELLSGADRGAADQARAALGDWIRSGLLPASDLVRLPWAIPAIDDSTLQAVSGALPARPLLVLLPQTGPFAQIGRRMARGAVLAAAEQEIPSVVVDEPIDPIQAALLTRGILRVLRPRAVVGPLLSNTASTVSLEMGRSAPDVPLVLPAATSPDVAALAPSAWQINITTRVQGAAAARMARECLGASDAFLLWPKGDFGEAVADGFRQEFAALGGRIAWQREYAAGSSDFRPQLESLRRTAQDLARQRGVDTAGLSPVVFVPSENPSDAVALSGQASQAGLKPRWIGASGWHSRQFLTEASARMEGALVVTDNVPDDARPAWKAFAARWRRSESDAPDRLAALGWDAARFSLLPRPVADFAGAQSEIRFEPGGRANSAAGRLRVERGAFVPVACPQR